MGYGTFRDDDYHTARSARVTAGIDDFEYTKRATHIHDTLDPKRINDKPFARLESRDSAEHPMSNPLILTFDVTGSNVQNAKVVQKELPTLMAKVQAVCQDPQIAIWANDDVFVEGENSIQLADFESDIRIDTAIRNIWLTGDGGGNNGESYDLLLYAAARKTVTDSYEKRGKKGIMIVYADEPFFDKVSAKAVNMVFGDNLEADIPIATIIAEAKQMWEIYVIWPSKNGFAHSRTQYVELFGDDYVITSQDPHMLCDTVASIVAAREQRYVANAMAATIDMTEDLHARVE